LPNDLAEPGENERRVESHTEYAQQLKNRLSKAFQTVHSAHKTQKHFYDRWARANIYKAGDRVLWLDRKTRRGRCMKLNRPWTGPWRIIKRLGEVVYRIKYEGSEKVSVKTSCPPQSIETVEESDSPETDDAVVVIEGPDVVAPIEDVEQDNNNPAEQPEPTNDNERPQRERRPPEWFVNYDMNF
jgi:hypothetical protein